MVGPLISRAAAAAAGLRQLSAAPSAAPGRLARRSLSTVPPPLSDSEMRLFRRVSEVESLVTDKLNAVDVEKNLLSAQVKQALKLLNKSTGKGATAVHEAANNAVVILTGVVAVALGVVAWMKPKNTVAVEATRALAESAKAAAESAAASAAAAQATAKALELKAAAAASSQDSNQ